MKKATILLLLAFLVIVSQYYLLADSLTLGFKPDDWILYFAYKTLDPNPLLQVASVWRERGLYTTYQVYYMGFLDSLVGFNYQAFHHINLIFKILATLSIYPLILVLFNRQLLAILAVIFFSISASTVGPLEFVVKGSDYLAIVWMNLFLITYYLIIINKLVGFKYHFLLFILFILSLGFSPIRLFPIIVIPILIETFLILRKLNAETIRKSFLRLFVLFSPFFLLYLYTNPISLYGNAYGPVGIFKKVSEGNWYMILSPISGIGNTFITNDYWGRIFGSIMVDSFKHYFYFLLGGPTIILGILTAFVAWSQIIRYKLLFFISTTLLNFLFQILVYFVAFHHLKLPLLQANYDPANLYSVIFGGYIFITGLIVFLYWLKWRNNDRIFAGLWVGSAILLIFTYLTWLFAPVGTGFSSTSYYLVVASVGSSLMLSAFLVSIYDKINSRVKLLVFLPFIILIPNFGMSSHTIREKFSSLNRDGRGAAGQIAMQQEARRVMKDYRAGDFALVYFDTSDITNGPFYSEGFLTSFPFFMHFKDNKLMDGCIGVIYEDNKMVELRKLVQARGEKRGFDHPALCVEGQNGGFRNLFFTADQFYAFKIEDKKLIDIKKKVLDQLDIKYYSR